MLNTFNKFQRMIVVFATDSNTLSPGFGMFNAITETIEQAYEEALGITENLKEWATKHESDIRHGLRLDTGALFVLTAQSYHTRACKEAGYCSGSMKTFYDPEGI